MCFNHIGVGIILFALPHFIIGRYHPGNAHSGNICSHGNSTLAQCAEPNSGGDWYYLALFVLAMLIMGAGGAPYFCLFNAYLDENVEPKSFPIYLGIFTVIQFIAPATGFLLGGKFLSIYVDINQPEGLKLSPKDPQWIGAWWLGFLIFGVAILFCSFVMFGFPRELPGAREKRLKHIREGNIQASNNVKHPSLRKMPGELKELLKNFTFLFNVLGFTCLTFYAGPVGSFLTKIVRVMFGLDAVNSGYFVSTAVFAGSVLGIIAGTIIVRMFSLKTTCKKAAAACVIAHLLAMGGAFIFMIPACENTNMAAVSVRYTSNATGLFTSQCPTTCNCSLKTFSPVCGSDNITYFDACHAGCTARLPDKTFTNCSCISSGGLAKPGYCDRQCKNVVIFIMIIVIISAIRFSTGVPSRTVILRCVPDNKRAFASGVWYVTFKTFGLLPSPVIFGHIMDESCTLWQSICGKRGRCFDYDVASLGSSIAYFGFSFSVLTTFCYFLSWYYCKSGKESVCIDNHETVESRETKL